MDNKRASKAEMNTNAPSRTRRQVLRYAIALGYGVTQEAAEFLLGKAKYRQIVRQADIEKKTLMEKLIELAF